MAKPVPLRPHTVSIAAPRELVFQMLSHFGRGRLPGDSNESSRVIEQDGDRLMVEFVSETPVGTYTTIEEVRLYPPERITFNHLSGPLRYVSEEFTLEEVDARHTDLTHSGEFVWRDVPLYGWLGGILYIRPVFERTMVKHMAQIKQAAEARAARSRVFPRA
ncbi:MAG: SRPBCC family protein [Chloroflexi bacterium]|nr:SRPBCC family protein [Chloroflexota bacterium]